MEAIPGKQGAWISKSREERCLGASLGNGPRGSGGVSTPPTCCERTNSYKAEKKMGCWPLFLLFLSHPAPCEEKASLGWQCGMLDAEGTGNLPRLPRLTLACCNRPLNPALLALIYSVLSAEGWMCIPSPSAEHGNATRSHLCHFCCPAIPPSAPELNNPAALILCLSISHRRQQRRHRALSNPGNVLLMGTSISSAER